METVMCVGCGAECASGRMCPVCDLCPGCCTCAGLGVVVRADGLDAPLGTARGDFASLVLAECAGCGERFVAAHPDYPILCVPCGEGFALLMAEQERVLHGDRTDFPGRCHSDVQCGNPHAELERAAPTIPELLSRLGAEWRWWFEDGDWTLTAA